MNGYIAFYRGRKAEVYAATSYDAQLKAAELFKARFAREVTVVLAEKAGHPIIHSTAGI